MLSEQKINLFTEELASAEPIPGGGSVSALSAALGMALGSMVANLTLPKAQAENAKEINSILVTAKELQEKFLALVDEDARVFQGVAAVFKMPKQTEEEKDERRRAMEKALQQAALPPLELARLCLEALYIQEKLLVLGTKIAISDVGVGSLLLGASLRGAYLNVMINLGSIRDQEYIKTTEAELIPLLNEGTQLAERIYAAVEAQLVP